VRSSGLHSTKLTNDSRDEGQSPEAVRMQSDMSTSMMVTMKMARMDDSKKIALTRCKLSAMDTVGLS